MHLLSTIRNDTAPAVHNQPLSPTVAEQVPPLDPVAWRGWEWGPDGPQLDDKFVLLGLGWNQAEIDKVNGILQATYRDYLALEAEHRERQPDSDGHQVTIVKRFLLPGIENRLWTQLDTMPTPEQQKMARLNLRFLPLYRYPEASPIRSSYDTRPSLLGFGGDPARVEIWRVGAWYHWRVNAFTGKGEPDFAADVPAESGPELPYELRRFWTDPPAEKEPPAQPEQK